MRASPPDLTSAFNEISRISRSDGRGRIFAVCAGDNGIGSSFVTRQLSLCAAQNNFETCLIDMDITQNAHISMFSSPEMQAHYGVPAGPYDCSFGVQPFWRVSPSVVSAQGQRDADAAFMGLYTIGATRLSVSGFMWDKLREGQSVHIARAREYWHALRDRFPLIFVDVPSVARSEGGSTVFGEVDGVIMVTDNHQSAHNSALLSAIGQVGGKCIGAIVNGHAVMPSYGDSA